MFCRPKWPKFLPKSISNREVLRPQGHCDAWPEGGELPLSFPSYVPKETLQPPSYMTSPGRPPMRSVLPSEVAKIPAKISNLEVLHPQGHPKRGWRAANSHLPFRHISQRRSDSLHHVWNRREGHQSRVICHLRWPNFLSKSAT